MQAIKQAAKRRIPPDTRRRWRRGAQARIRALRAPLRRPRFREAVSQLVQEAPGGPSPEALELLVHGWDNPAAGDLGYLRAVVELSREADGPILECGSGLTTVLLGIYADTPVWTLEADEAWHARLRSELERSGIPAQHLLHAPLEDHGDFHWYRLPADLPEEFALVVCDGPAAAGLPGGRTGLMPVVGGRLRSGARVVVDRGMVSEGSPLVWERDHGLVAEDASTPHRVYRVP